MRNKIVVTSMLTALLIVLKSYLAITTPIMRISFAFFPLALTGILYGPMWAGISGGVGAVIGLLLYPVAGFHPGLTLSAVLSGIVYGAILHNKARQLWRIICAVFINNFIISCGLSTIWVYQMTGQAIRALLPIRIVQNILMAPIMILMIWVLGYKIIELRYNKKTISGDE